MNSDGATRMKKRITMVMRVGVSLWPELFDGWLALYILRIFWDCRNARMRQTLQKASTASGMRTPNMATAV